MAEDNPYLKLIEDQKAAGENPYLKLIQPTEAKPTVEPAPTGFGSQAEKMARGMLNVFPAARQGVTPDIEQHRQNYLGPATVDEQGNVLIKGPNGLVPTVAGEHVVLQNPGTGQYGVYAKTPATSENPAVSASRMLTQGLLTASPGIGVAKAGAAAPTLEQLRASYTAAKNSPEVGLAFVRPQATGKFVEQAQATLAPEWLGPQTPGSQIPSLAPRTNAVLDKMRESGVLSYGEIDKARRLLGDIAGAPGEEGTAATIVKRELDKWLGKLPPEAAITGSSPIPEAQATMQAGRGNYARMKVGQALDEKLANATGETGAANSGMNLDNKLRQGVTAFLKTDEASQLTDAERAALEGFRSGSLSRNALRAVSNTLGGGGGLGTLLTADVGSRAAELVSARGGIGAVAGIAMATAGHVLKRLENAISARDAAKISEAIRSNSPLGRKLQASFDAAGPVFSAVGENRYSPRLLAQFNIQARNLSNNLKDAGVNLSPDQIIKSVTNETPEATRSQ